MKISYEDWRPYPSTRSLLKIAEVVAETNHAEGHTLTLRQLFYRLVEAGWVENTKGAYKSLGETINRARLAGLFDWDHLADRAAPRPASHDFDLWASQAFRVEVWVEKEGLAGQVSNMLAGLDVPVFSAPTYLSQAAARNAAERHRGYTKRGQTAVILQLSDLDEVGLDMARDIGDRLDYFGASTIVERIGITEDQATEWALAPSWSSGAAGLAFELEAIKPSDLRQLVLAEVMGYVDQETMTRDTDKGGKLSALFDETRYLDRLQSLANLAETIGDTTRAKALKLAVLKAAGR